MHAENPDGMMGALHFQGRDQLGVCATWGTRSRYAGRDAGRRHLKYWAWGDVTAMARGRRRSGESSVRGERCRSSA